MSSTETHPFTLSSTETDRFELPRPTYFHPSEPVIYPPLYSPPYESIGPPSTYSRTTSVKAGASTLICWVCVAILLAIFIILLTLGLVIGSRGWHNNDTNNGGVTNNKSSTAEATTAAQTVSAGSRTTSKASSTLVSTSASSSSASSQTKTTYLSSTPAVSSQATSTAGQTATASQATTTQKEDANLFCDLINYCLNGATCISANSTYYYCVCSAGFTGERCETPTLALEDSAPLCTAFHCLNGGTCIQTIEKLFCHCLPEFTGEFCESPMTEMKVLL